MPRKSDRPEHESKMSSLMPDVSLDEDQEEDDEKEELKSSRTKEEKNYSSVESSGRHEAEENPRGGRQESGHSPSKQRGLSGEGMAVFPGNRPELEQKLGPYVSDEVSEALEEVYLRLRRRFGSEASKSLIVEAALRYFLADCIKHGEESEAADWMSRVLNSDA